jgi:hypothetical protein
VTPTDFEFARGLLVGVSGVSSSDHAELQTAR